MRITKEGRGFPAVLKDQSGAVLAEGQATVLAETRTVEFRSDFVPMYRMGVPLQVVRMFEGQEIHIFSGTVFISDRNMLRLVSITDRLLPGSENVYFSETKIPAVLRLVERCQPLVQPKRRFSWFHRRPKEPEQPETAVYTVTVSALSGRQLEFTSNQIFGLQDRFAITLQLEKQELADLPIFISRAFAFGKGCLYRCTFDTMDTALREQLNCFVKNMNQQENSFFPQEKAPAHT